MCIYIYSNDNNDTNVNNDNNDNDINSSNTHENDTTTTNNNDNDNDNGVAGGAPLGPPRAGPAHDIHRIVANINLMSNTCVDTDIVLSNVSHACLFDYFPT